LHSLSTAGGFSRSLKTVPSRPTRNRVTASNFRESESAKYRAGLLVDVFEERTLVLGELAHVGLYGEGGSSCAHTPGPPSVRGTFQIAGKVVSLFLLGFLTFGVTSGSGWLAHLAPYISVIEHMRDFARGVVDTRPVVFYVSGTVLFLFLTLKAVESRRWK